MLEDLLVLAVEVLEVVLVQILEMME